MHYYRIALKVYCVQVLKLVEDVNGINRENLVPSQVQHLQVWELNLYIFYVHESCFANLKIVKVKDARQARQISERRFGQGLVQKQSLQESQLLKEFKVIRVLIPKLRFVQTQNGQLFYLCHCLGVDTLNGISVEVKFF